MNQNIPNSEVEKRDKGNSIAKQNQKVHTHCVKKNDHAIFATSSFLCQLMASRLHTPADMAIVLLRNHATFTEYL